ncbi:methylthioribose-1-phosphate isomerase [Desulfocarbo indianensis]|nr:methylthioribose-1-phosphate isomerase [Desulfocarbo indianensis]
MIPTLYWEKDAVMILDQRKLPGRTVFIPCRDMRRVIYCIQTLATRGAPAIGVAAAMGLALAAQAIRVKDPARFRARFRERAEVMRAARPTAVNLSWAVDRCLALLDVGPDNVETLKAMLRRESQIMLDEDVAINRAMGRFGAELVPDGATVLTHCNAGSLATGGYGTALGVVYAAREAGKQVAVIADETRPLLQGARLTAWEMVLEGIPVRVAVDGAVGAIMSKGLVDLAVVGADRIAMNGDVANKIGTFNVALQAQRHGVPFYVAAPLSTIDPNAASGADIPIEERDPREVLELAGKRIAPSGAQALNFAFDVTPHDLVAAIITEKGVLRPPFTQSLGKAKAAA